MRGLSRRKLFAVGVLALSLVACSGSNSELNSVTATAADQSDAVYYLVRHAEKVLDQKDPPLTDIGEQRAQDLASRLSGVKLTTIYSTDTVRTRDTAAPTAAEKNLTVQIYDGRALPSFALQLLGETGHIVVVGHSNTTPDLAGLLGGEAGEPIVEASEYDRFYVLRRSGEDVTSTIERFGQ